MERLKTERLLLRGFRKNDLADLYAYAKNPHVGPAAGWKPHADITESAKWLKEFIDKQEVWAIVEKISGKVIGSIGLHADRKRNNERAGMLGYVLDEPYWGRGLATEAARKVIEYAFRVRHYELLSIYHYPFNRRSARVIEKCGFHYEGTLRQASQLYSGLVHDDVCYSMTRTEYDTRFVPGE